jgi:IS30 family transposase
MESTTKHYQQLQPEDRVTISSLKQQNYGIRAIARMLRRPASTISRELRRNGSSGHYGSAEAQQACQRRRRQSRPQPKLHVDGLLFGVVQHFLKQRWSPEQIALALAHLYPKGHKIACRTKPFTTVFMPNRSAN